MGVEGRMDYQVEGFGLEGLGVPTGGFGCPTGLTVEPCFPLQCHQHQFSISILNIYKLTSS